MQDKPKTRRRRKFTGPREKPEFDQQIVDLARVTRVTKGGKQLNFRACVLIGDRKGRVGYGVQKGKDVQLAVEKAVRQAKKQLIRIPIIHDTIPHAVISKYKAAKVILKPAPQGSGVIAGSVIRTVLEMAGVPNASSKMVGKTNNKITNIKAVFDALNSFHKDAIARATTSKKNTEKKIEKIVKKPTAKIIKSTKSECIKENKKEVIEKKA